MDASPTSSGSGFDAALKALEDLETSVVQTREDATPALSATLSVAPADPVAVEDEPAPITAIPVAEAAAVDLSPPFGPAEPPVPGAQAAPAPEAMLSSPGKLGRVAIGIALLSSLLSAAGLVVAERTIMSAQLVVADARERQQQLHQAGVLIRELQLVRDRQVELLQAQRLQAAAMPVTSEDLQRRMDALQTGLLARDPLNNVIQAIREGQTDTNARFSEFGLKMARVEAALKSH